MVPIAFKIADGYVEVHGRLDEASFREAARRAGDRAGRDADHHFTTAFGRATKSGQSRGRLRGFFQELLTPDEDLMESLLHPLERFVSVPLVAALAAGIVSLGAGAIAAAISSAVLLGIGGAVLGGAGFILAKQLKEPFKHATHEIGKTLRRAASPLIQPFKDAMHDMVKLTHEQEDQFHAIFKAAAPIVPLLSQTFREFAEEILPTIGQIMPYVVDLFEVLAQRSPEIADAITRLFKAMADEETVTAFSYLLGGLIFTIDLLGGTLKFLTRSFNKDIEDIKHGARLASGVFNEIRGLVGKIPAKKILKFLFQPGNAIGTILRVTGLTRNIPRAWHTVYKFLRGNAAILAAGARRLVGQIPKAWHTVYKFLRGNAVGAIKSVISWLGRIPRNVTTTITTVTRNIVQSIKSFVLGNAQGGLIGGRGMATGGLFGSGSTVMVGEQGPELVNLPFGSRVTSAGQSRAQLGQASAAGGPMVLEINSGGSRLDDLLVEVLRKAVRSRGGDVQAVLGS